MELIINKIEKIIGRDNENNGKDAVRSYEPEETDSRPLSHSMQTQEDIEENLARKFGEGVYELFDNSKPKKMPNKDGKISQSALDRMTEAERMKYAEKVIAEKHKEDTRNKYN